VKKKSIIVIMLALLALAAIVVVLNFTLRGNRFDTALPIRGHTVTRGRLEDRVSGNGTFAPRSAVTVVAQVSGEVASVAVREGDTVRAGQLLLSLRDDDYVLTAQKLRAALESARRGVRQSLLTLRSQYLAAVRSLEDAERTLKRNETLFAARSIAEDVLDRSRDAAESARAGAKSAKEQLNLRCGLDETAEPPLDSTGDDRIVESSPEVVQARLSLRSAEDSIRRCRIVSPQAGTVTMVRPAVGDIVSPSLGVARVESLDDMLAEIQIDEVDIGKIRVGQTAELTSDSLIGHTLQGTVESISPTVTAVGSTRVGSVELRIETEEGLPIRSGASCTARISTSVKEGVLLIPLSGFVSEDSVSYVFLLSSTGERSSRGDEVYRLSRHEVTTGSSDVTSVEIVSGLTDGDVIATGNLNLLRDGVLVTLRRD